MPATTGMKCAGYYDRHSRAQLSAIEAIQDWVNDAVANLPLPALLRPVTILDLGSSEGRNAVRLMADVVAGLRRRATSTPASGRSWVSWAWTSKTCPRRGPNGRGCWGTWVATSCSASTATAASPTWHRRQ